MSLFTFSTDATTPGPTSRQPRTSKDLATGEWVMLNPSSDEAEYNRCGWYVVTEVAQPTADHLRSISNGPAFTEVWTFDQATADDLADANDRDADGAQLGQSLAAMRSIIDSSGSVPAADVRKIARAVARLIRSQRLDQQ